jgi:hypothetical protein
MIHDSRAPDPRRALLVAALGFCCCSGRRESGGRVRAWTEAGQGQTRAGSARPINRTPSDDRRMARQGYELSLARYADVDWRATFYVTGREHSPTGATGSAFEATPFRAVQAAAWETLART